MTDACMVTMECFLDFIVSVVEGVVGCLFACASSKFTAGCKNFSFSIVTWIPTSCSGSWAPGTNGSSSCGPWVQFENFILLTWSGMDEHLHRHLDHRHLDCMSPGPSSISWSRSVFSAWSGDCRVVLGSRVSRADIVIGLPVNWLCIVWCLHCLATHRRFD